MLPIMGCLVVVTLVMASGCSALVGAGPTVVYQFGRGARFGVEATAGMTCDAECRSHDEDTLRSLVRVSAGATLSSRQRWRETLAWTPAYSLIPNFGYAGLVLGGAYEQGESSSFLGTWTGLQAPIGGGYDYYYSGSTSVWGGAFVGFRWTQGTGELFLATTLSFAKAGYYVGGN